MPFQNTMQPIKILIAEDFHVETDALLRELNDSEFNHISEIVRTEEEFKNGLHRFDPDVILSPYSLASTNAVKLLSIARNEGMNMPFILLAYDLSEDIAIELLGEGIEDYILRSTLKRLPVAIRKALQRYKTQLELQLSDVKLRESEASLQKAQKMAKVGS
jgi:DNA-binding NtrC family response regulator